MTLQRRLLAYLALAAIASCTLTVGVAVVLVRHRIATQRMTALEAKATLVSLLGGVPGAMAAGAHVYNVGTGTPLRARPAVRAAVLAAIPPAGNAQGTITVRGRPLLYAARVTAVGRIVLFRGGRLAFAEWRPFLTSLILAVGAGIALAVALSLVLARRLARPIGALAGATHRVAAGESDVAVPVAGGDELADLGRSFNAMAAELTRAREAQRGFLESVSHELKTPLTSIRGYAEALEEGAVTPADGARVIASEADRLQQLVGDLLDLARFGRAGFTVGRRPVDLVAVADAVVARHQPRARELGVQLRLAGAAAAWATGDAARLLQAASNLVENALRLTPPGGEVTVATAPDGTLSVADTGPGLAPEDVPRAFDRFYLYDRYRSERVVGSGLGLAIVRELAAAMGGSVEAAARRGGGAQFTIRLQPVPAPVAAPG
jgi:two-component system OmpR family sensor kinase